MNDNRTIQALLENSLRTFAALGIQRKPDDVESYMRYREGLIREERDRFDDLLKTGAFPGAAAESVEIASGRLKPQGVQEEKVASEIEVRL